MKTYQRILLVVSAVLTVGFGLVVTKNRECVEYREVVDIKISLGGFFHSKPFYEVRYSDGDVDVSSFGSRKIGEKECVKWERRTNA